MLFQNVKGTKKQTFTPSACFSKSENSSHVMGGKELSMGERERRHQEEQEESLRLATYG